MDKKESHILMKKWAKDNRLVLAKCVKCDAVWISAPNAEAYMLLNTSKELPKSMEVGACPICDGVGVVYDPEE